jgi:Flp pilus assembly protein TadG
MKLLRRLLRSDREDGQATFEFALLIPLFILAVLLVVDGGIWMYKFVSVSNAVRDAARYGSVTCSGNTPCNQDAIIARAEQSSSGFLSAADDDWSGTGWISRSGSSTDINEKGDSVVVRVSQSHQLLFLPFITVGVASCAEMRLEQPNDDGMPASTTDGCG